MDKKTGTIITAVVGVIALLCCTIPLCLLGISFFAEVDWEDFTGLDVDYIPPGWGTLPCCISILVLIVPLLLWVLMVRGKNGDRAVKLPAEEWPESA
jgi:hypothetical protein